MQDGYLLKNFVQAGVPCLGVECAANLAEAARTAGVNSVCAFFGSQTAAQLKDEHGAADLILGNNVLAHVPDINDFVAGLRTALKPDVVIVLEFPMASTCWRRRTDCIYHEHVFYFTLTPLLPLFARHGLEIFHIEHYPIHGGSLRIFAAHQGVEEVRPSVAECRANEEVYGVTGAARYQGFQQRAAKIATDLSAFLEQQHSTGRRVAAYGAAAKGSTLLNCVGESARALDHCSQPQAGKNSAPDFIFPIVAVDEPACRSTMRSSSPGISRMNSCGSKLSTRNRVWQMGGALA